jgi:ChaB
MMPRSSRYRGSAAGELPGTLRRSSPEAQAAFRQAHKNAVQAYGETDEAYRAAYTALKQDFEKRGDQWIAKAEPAA